MNNWPDWESSFFFTNSNLNKNAHVADYIVECLISFMKKIYALGFPLLQLKSYIKQPLLIK